MSDRNRGALVLAALSVAVAGCEKKATAPQLPPHQQLLVNTIQLQGGSKKLKAASSFSARYQAELMGMVINGTVKHRAGSMRLEHVDKLSGNPVVQVAADGKCWQKVGRAVLPCHQALAEHATRFSRLLEASWLWPLEGSDRKLEAKKVELGGKSYDGLVVSDAAGGTIGSLAIDANSSLVAGVRLETTLLGTKGELVGVFSEPEEHCGVKVPTKRVYTFDSKPYLSEKLSGIFCEAIDDRVFARPEQVKNGLTEIRHTYDTPLACTRLKGELSGVSAAMDRVVSYMAGKGLAPLGAAALVHRKGPPRVKRPAAYLTDVCFPVSKKAWVMPKADWKGEFFLDQIAGDEVLAAFGVGPLKKTSVELPRLLYAEAKKQGRKPSGAMTQRVYMRPADFPAEQLITEMHLPLD